MEVIGTTSNDYICVINHSELEKFTNTYFNKMKRLKIGDKIDLGAGYNFMSKTQSALRATDELIKNNKDVVEAILNGITIMANEKETND